MKLTIQDAARLLNTSESSVYRWIRDGKIPFQRVDRHYRFHRAELLEWATANGIGVSAEAFPVSRRFDAPLPRLSSALRSGGVYHHVEATDRDTALRAIIQHMPLLDESDRELLFDVMLAREALGSTGVGEGIAIPHVRSPVVLRTAEASVSLCFLDRPIEFEAIDGKPVHTFFSIVTPTIPAHLHLLSRLSAALADPIFRAAITQRGTAEDIVRAAESIDGALDAKAARTPAP